MTWVKALPVLIIALIFDALRCFFEMFWFFGPALAGAICTITVKGVLSTWTAGLFGAKTAALACGSGATIVGYFGAPVIGVFGVVMAIAVGLAGWLTIGFILMMTNARIFKENEGHALWFAFSLLISEVPIIGAVPGLTGITIKMYSTQIKKDKVLIKKWEKEQAELRRQERDQKIANLVQQRTAEPAQAEIY